MEAILRLYRKYRETINYLFFGVVTTIVNFVIYYLLLFTGMHYIVAQVIAWIGAVIVAYITNKLWVFDDHAKGVRAIAKQFCSFTASRLFSFGIETLLLYLMVDVGSISDRIAKLPVAVLTVILNYVTGKLIVFRRR